MNNEDALKAIDAALFALELAANIQSMIARYNIIKAESSLNDGHISPETLRSVLDEAERTLNELA